MNATLHRCTCTGPMVETYRAQAGYVVYECLHCDRPCRRGPDCPACQRLYGRDNQPT